MFAMIFGIISAALSGMSSLSNSASASSAQQQQAAQLEANAKLARREAQIEERRGRQEAFEQDRQRSRLTREFRQSMGQNRVALGAGNVDMASGSALDVAMGNIDAYATDMQDNAYAVAMKNWESAEKVKQTRAQASIMDSNASYLKNSANNLLGTLLSTSMAGFGGFTSGYSAAGGSLSNLFGAGSSGG